MTLGRGRYSAVLGSVGRCGHDILPTTDDSGGIACRR
jgi:hypothetical protein